MKPVERYSLSVAIRNQPGRAPAHDPFEWSTTMFAASTALARRAAFAASAAAALGGLALLAGSRPALPPAAITAPAEGAVPTAREVHGPAAVVPLDTEPPAKIV